jgi:hypothetical protein
MRFQVDYTEAFYGRGNAYLGAGDKERACDDFHTAYENGYAPAKTNIDNFCTNHPKKKANEDKPKSGGGWKIQ